MSEPVKKLKPRKVFGRVRVAGIGGTSCLITMTKTALHVRPYNSRTVWSLSTKEVARLILANGQSVHTPTIRQGFVL